MFHWLEPRIQPSEYSPRCAHFDEGDRCWEWSAYLTAAALVRRLPHSYWPCVPYLTRLGPLATCSATKSSWTVARRHHSTTHQTRSCVSDCSIHILHVGLIGECTASTIFTRGSKVSLHVLSSWPMPSKIIRSFRATVGTKTVSQSFACSYQRSSTSVPLQQPFLKLCTLPVKASLEGSCLDHPGEILIYVRDT